MKELLGEFADAQIMMYKSAMEDWDKVSLVCSFLSFVSFLRRVVRSSGSPFFSFSFVLSRLVALTVKPSIET